MLTLAITRFNFYFFTFPLDLTPFIRQRKTTTQAKSKAKGRSYLKPPRSPRINSINVFTSSIWNLNHLFQKSHIEVGAAYNLLSTVNILIVLKQQSGRKEKERDITWEMYANPWIDYQFWSVLSFVQGLCLISKEVKQGVTYISYNQCYKIAFLGWVWFYT